MNQTIACIRCRTPMEPGYVADATSGGNVQEQWSPGAPQTSYWTGLKIDTRARIPVTTMRCPNCGVLESYARPST
ncbi:MAG TPA: hypothetical protein VGD56_20890 [Gemmatirosa sp.]